MIEIQLWRDQGARPLRLLVHGHAGQGRYGEDIVCAAASALTETLRIGLTDVLHEAPTGAIGPGHADITFYQPMSDQVQAVVETIVRGFQDLRDTAPKAVVYTEERLH